MNVFTKALDFIKFNNEVMNWVKFNGQLVYEAFKKLLANGIPPLTLTKCKGEDLIDYKIKGNSVEKPILPVEYQQVAYIESTGTQYIQTDYIANQSTNSKGTYQIMDVSAARMLFGARTKSASSDFYGFNWGGSSPFKLVNAFYIGRTTTTEADTKKHTFEKISNVLYLDGTRINTNNEAIEEWDTTYPIAIFGCNSAGTVGFQSSSRLYDLQFSEGDVKLYHFIPCYRKSDGEIGLYDIVNDVFYTNDGEGTFLKGADAISNIEPTPDNPIEVESVGDYDESTGKYKIPVRVNSENLLDLSQLSSTSVYKYGDYGIKQIKTQYTNGGFKFPVNIPAGSQLYISYKYVESFGDADDSKAVYLRAYTSSGNRKNIFLRSNHIDGKFYVYACDVLTEDIVQLEFYTMNTWETGSYYIIDAVKITYEKPISHNLFLDEPLRKIGEYTDNIDFKNQKVIRNVGNKIFDGTENWEIHTTTDEGTVFRLDNVLTPLIGASINDTYMTHFSLTDIYSTATFTNGLYRFGYNQDTLTISSNRLYVSAEQTTVEDFKNWLAENKPSISYPLAEVSEEQIELPSIPTFKGTTIIEVETSIQPSNMEVVYLGKGDAEMLDEYENSILNSIINDNTETQLDRSETEINQILDEIIGG